MATGRLVRGVDDVACIGIRKYIGVTLNYKDRNDGFMRSWFSRNKVNRSRIYALKLRSRKAAQRLKELARTA